MRHGNTLFVLTTPTGHLRDMRVAGSFSPDWAAVDTATATIRRTCAAADISGTIDDSGIRAMRNAGQWLFDELLPFSTKTLLRTGSGTLLLSLDPQLLDIPWELLHADDQFLCERWGIGRSVQDDIHHEAPGATTPPMTRVQIIADPDGSLNDAYAEGEALYQRLRRHPSLDVSVRSGDVDLAYLRQHIRDGHVLHYAGHVDGNRLRLAGEPFEPAHLERLAGSGGLPRLVFLNGCAALRCTDWETSLVRAWRHAGAGFLVGPTQPLPDRLGLLFAEAFYRELLQGACVGAAIRDAKAALTRQIGPAAAVWGAYVLYGDPAETLFETAQRRQQRPELRRIETRLAGSPLRASERPALDAESAEQALRLVRMPVDPWWLLAGFALALAFLALGALR
jgi:hypothetical protein